MIFQKYAKSFEYRNNYFEDLLQAAKIGIHQSLSLYDKNKSKQTDGSFWVYAKKRVEGSIKDELDRILGVIHAPREVKQLAYKIEKNHRSNNEISDMHSTDYSIQNQTKNISHAIEYLKMKNLVSMEAPLSNNQNGSTVGDLLYASPKMHNEALTDEFLSLLNYKERKVAKLLNHGYSSKEAIKRYKDGRELVASIGKKLKEYLKIGDSILEESIMNNKSTKITKEIFDQLKIQNISNKEIAKRYKMSTTTLTKLRHQWGAKELKSLDVQTENNETMETTKTTISEIQFKKLSDAFEKLKSEYELLWKYHKQSLQRMNSPFTWNE